MKASLAAIAELPLPLGFREKTHEVLEHLAGDIPRGALTEIAGMPSTGRTSLLYSLLAAVTFRQEMAALLDVEDTFDPESAAAAGVQLSQVLWVRCGGNVERALKAADLLSQGGGFGLVAIDLGDTPARLVRRIPMAAWHRLRLGVENTRTVLVAMGQQINARSCSSLKIELDRERVLWRGRLPGGLLEGIDVAAQYTRNRRAQKSKFAIRR